MEELNIKQIDLRVTLGSSRVVGLWRLMEGYRLIYLIANITVGLAASMKTATYFLIGFLVDELLAKGRYELLPWVALGFVLLAIAEGALTFATGWLAAKSAESMAVRLRDYLFDHLQRLSFSYHDQAKTGELIQRVTSDIDAVASFFRTQGIGFGRILLLFLINILGIMRINVSLAFISVIVVPIITAISIYFFHRISAAYERFQDQEAKMSAVLQENLTGVRVVKAFTQQQFEIDKFKQENKKTFNEGSKLLWMHSVFWPFSDIVSGYQMLLGFSAGAYFAINGVITPGEYIAFAGMIIWIIWPMRNLGRLIIDSSKALVSYERVNEIIAIEKEATAKGIARKLEGAVVFRGVDFAYETGNNVLQGIDLDVLPGQVIALMGGTGSGKSSLLNLLPRFYPYQAGEVLLDGIPLTEYAPHSLRQQIGIVEQEPFLFSRTIRENICYGVGHAVSDEEVEKAARVAAIHDLILTLPDGYKTLVGERGVTLSGGQKQRISIARTLLKDPRILILDDATSAIDSETEAEIREALQQLMVGRTTFIIAHRIQSVVGADQIVVLQDGKIIQRGTHQQLLEDQSAFYHKVFSLQAEIEEELQVELGE